MARLHLFSKNIGPSCSYCRFGYVSYDGYTVLCEKYGISQADASCKKFQYAPLKRIPKRPKSLPRFEEADFKL